MGVLARGSWVKLEGRTRWHWPELSELNILRDKEPQCTAFNEFLNSSPCRSSDSGGTIAPLAIRMRGLQRHSWIGEIGNLLSSDFQAMQERENFWLVSNRSCSRREILVKFPGRDMSAAKFSSIRFPSTSGDDWWTVEKRWIVIRLYKFCIALRVVVALPRYVLRPARVRSGVGGVVQVRGEGGRILFGDSGRED